MLMNLLLRRVIGHQYRIALYFGSWLAYCMFEQEWSRDEAADMEALLLDGYMASSVCWWHPRYPPAPTI